MNITAKSESGEVIGLVQHDGYWIRPAKWHDPEKHYDAVALNHQEKKDRTTNDPIKAQRWADAMARAIP